jgi:hypothetical protein
MGCVLNKVSQLFTCVCVNNCQSEVENEFGQPEAIVMVHAMNNLHQFVLMDMHKIRTLK